MKTVLRVWTKIASMFLENRSDTVHKYVHVVLRTLCASCTLKGSHNMLVPAVEVTANESNEPNKAKFKVRLII